MLSINDLGKEAIAEAGYIEARISARIGEPGTGRI
jgi:hypothetical protein